MSTSTSALNLINTATCYLPYAAILLITVLYFPALAFFPRLTSRPILATSIPIISIGIISIIALALFYCGIYSHLSVLIVTFLLCIIALYRLWRESKKQTALWNNDQFALLMINLGIILPMIALTGLSAFMVDDALISWNVWALQFYHNIWPATGGYPPLFPLFISYAYKLLGHPEYQGPVKVLLCVFPLTILNAIAFSNNSTAKYLWLYFIIILISVFPGFLDFSFYRFYTRGYADPLFTTALICSVLLLLNYLNYPHPSCGHPSGSCSKAGEDNKSLYLWLAVICGAVAALTKQPGLLWALWGFPILLIRKAIIQKKFIFQDFFACIVLLTPVVIWLLSGGSYFYNNQGVISRSLSNQEINLLNLLSTLWQSFITYFLKQPTILLLYIFACIAAWKNLYKNLLFWGFIIPETILWLIFGAYEIRLGLHVLVLCGLLIMSAEIPLRFALRPFTNGGISTFSKVIFYLGLILFLFFSLREQVIKHHDIQGHIYPLNGPKSVIYHYFSDGAPFVYQNIYLHSELKLWITTPYISSIFYANNQIINPPNSADPEIIYQNLLLNKPDYIFTSSKITTQASIGLAKLIQQCPDLFHEISLGQPLYQYYLYYLVLPVRTRCSTG